MGECDVNDGPFRILWGRAMSKDIWHKWPEKPDGDKFIIEKYLVPWGKTEINQYDLYCWDDGQIDYRSEWCYLDELLALETELDRTRKALKLALDWLRQVATPEKCDDDLCREFTKRKLVEIKTALGQKDK